MCQKKNIRSFSKKRPKCLKKTSESFFFQSFKSEMLRSDSSIAYQSVYGISPKIYKSLTRLNSISKNTWSIPFCNVLIAGVFIFYNRCFIYVTQDSCTGC